MPADAFVPLSRSLTGYEDDNGKTMCELLVSQYNNVWNRATYYKEKIQNMNCELVTIHFFLSQTEWVQSISAHHRPTMSLYYLA